MSNAQNQPGQLLFAGLPGPETTGDLADLIRAGRVGGVTLFARNVESPDQLRSLVAELHDLAPDEAPLCVAIDQEGGRVQRMRAPWTEFPPMRCVGQRDDLAETAAVATALGRELADMGIDLDFAPSCDVDSNPENPVIGDRSFGATSEQVARQAQSFIRALQASGVAGCAKHFPGHGDTLVDSHHALPRLETNLDRLRAVELPPFAAAIEAEVACFMTAHVVLEQLDAARPATLSPTAMALLRRELGFDGLVFTDDLEMKAIADHHSPAEIVAGVQAADVDVLLVCSRVDLRDDVLEALEGSSEAVLRRSLERMRRFKAMWVGRAHAEHPNAGPPYPAHLDIAARLKATGSGDGVA